jgi:hypothetical protein
MNKKLYLNLVLFIVGSFIIIITGSIITSNFLKDARIFARPVVEAKAEVDAKVSEIKEENDEKTIKYQRAADAKGSKVDIGEDIPKKKNNTEATTASTKVKIEVFNYTGIKSAGEDVKKTLEAAGFSIELKEQKADKNVKTEIVERNSKKLGKDVQEVLNAGKIIVAIDSKSKFDVTLKIGNDYKP